MSSPITVVQKFGGACLETPAKLRAVASSLATLHRQGQQVVVVVSAMGKTTDALIKTAYEVSPHPNRRELDMLLSTGERVSMALLSMALSDLGVPAISFTGSQAGVLTDNSHSAARIMDVKPLRVREELQRGRLVVLAGFQGVNPLTKEITTLGRGGSDTTAVAMAAALRADRCEIIKEVDGVCSADPRLVSAAHNLAELDYATLGEMCFWGAKVLHFRCVELAMSQNVQLVIKREGEHRDSTRIVRETRNMETGKILAVNSLARVEHLEIEAPSLNEGFDRLSNHLRTQNLPWPQILASTYEGGKCRLMFTADAESLDALMQSLEKTSGLSRHRPTLSSVSITCYGSVASDLPHRALQLLRQSGLVAEKYILSPQSLNLFVQPELREDTVRALHAMI